MKQLKIVLIIILVGLVIALCTFTAIFIHRGTGSFSFNWSGNGNLLSGDVTMVRETKLEAEDIQNINISYSDSSDIYFFESTDEQIQILEYMNNDADESDLANIAVNKNTLNIKGAKRTSKIINFYRGYVEIYLPAKQWKQISTTIVSGNIENHLPLNVSEEFLAETVSGEIMLHDITAGQLRFNTVSGEITATGITGKTNAESVSGEMELSYSELVSDVKANSVSGDINISIPETSQFIFTAGSVSGHIETFVDKYFSYDKRKKNVKGRYGENPSFEISIETVSGEIEVEKN